MLNIKFENVSEEKAIEISEIMLEKFGIKIEYSNYKNEILLYVINSERDECENDINSIIEDLKRIKRIKVIIEKN